MSCRGSLIALVALASLAGCYNGLQGNAPFNCTRNHECPSPLVCRSNQCQSPDAGPIPCEDGGLCSGGGVCLQGYGCATVLPCDPVAQNCVGNELPRCTLVTWNLNDGGESFPAQCVPLTPKTGIPDAGPATGDPSLAPCTWTSKDYNLDSCPRGSICVDYGDGAHCHAYCGASSSCSGSESCVLYTTTFGICNAVCTDDSSCRPTEQACRPAPTLNRSDNLFCEPAGSGVNGSSCTYNDDCGQDLVCINSTCRTLCEVSFSTCQPGYSCSTYYYTATGQNSSYGYCH